MSSPVVSEMLAAPVVAVIEVRSADLAAPTRDGDGYLVQDGTLEIEVVEVVKGRLAARPTDVLSLRVVVGAARFWTEADLRAGSRWVVFCDASTLDARALLTPGHCLRKAPAALVLDDVHLVREIQRRHPTADRLLGAAERHRGVAGEVFARYVWVAVREAVRGSAERFDRLMAVAEDPGTLLAAQRAYLVSAYEDVTFTGEFPDAQRARLARAMAAGALDPRLGELRSAVLGTYLPNLVRSAAPRALSADEVFGAGDAGPLRDALLAELDDPRDPATDSPVLRAWLTAAPSTEGSR